MMNFYKETERLILRAPTYEDAEALANLRSTEFVLKYNLYKTCDKEQIIRELDTFEHILIQLKESNKIIGCISIREDDFRYHIDSVVLHAWLTEENAYKGYMKEALEPVIYNTFVNCQHERIALQIIADNIASIRLAEKLSFEREGYLKRALKNHNDQVFDVVLYSLSREDYLNKIK